MSERGPVPARYLALDRRVSAWMARHGVPLLRISVGIVFVWFGALKLVPGLSPAAELIATTFPFMPGRLFIPFVGVWEVAIGLGYLSGRFVRITVALMFLQMLGAMSPLLLNPAAVFSAAPLGLTLEGQYIVKNIVLMAAALVIGATVRRRDPSSANP